MECGLRVRPFPAVERMDREVDMKLIGMGDQSHADAAPLPALVSCRIFRESQDQFSPIRFFFLRKSL